VISGINAYKPWHAYFPEVGTSGATLGTLNALMTIGNFCGAPFLAFADGSYYGLFLSLVFTVLGDANMSFLHEYCSHHLDLSWLS
jgi:hypothetical protein